MSVFPTTPVIRRPILQQIRENLARRNHPNVDSSLATNDRNVTTIGTGQLTVTVNPQQIGIVSRKRIAIKLTNLSVTTEIWWSSIPGLIPGSGQGGNGDLLPAGRGQWISIPGAAVIWVAVASGTAQMSWAEKYEDDEHN